MKKILIATTALVATAGIASAEVSVSGNGRLGVTYDGSKDTDKAAFTSRLRIVFSASGETDGGLSFGGSIRADNSVAGAAGTAGSVYVSGAFGKLSMGDTSGAAENATGDLAGVGLTGVGDYNEMTYLSGGQIALFSYTTGSLTLMASHTNPGLASKVGSLAAVYSANGFTLAAGVEAQNKTDSVAATTTWCTTGSAPAFPDLNGGDCTPGLITLEQGTPATGAVGSLTHFTLAAAYTMDAITVKAAYGNLKEKGVAGSADQYGLSATYKMDAVSVTAFGRRDFDKNQHIGIGAAYDLGGGAKVMGGLVNTNFDEAGKKSRTKADFGVSLSF